MKQAIVIDLDALRELLREYLDEVASGDETKIRHLMLSHFLEWVRKRQQTKGKDDGTETRPE